MQQKLYYVQQQFTYIHKVQPNIPFHFLKKAFFSQMKVKTRWQQIGNEIYKEIECTKSRD